MPPRWITKTAEPTTTWYVPAVSHDSVTGPEQKQASTDNSYTPAWAPADTDSLTNIGLVPTEAVHLIAEFLHTE